MEEQEFVVKIKALPYFYRYFPKIDADILARIIRNNVRAKSRGCILPTPFEITVEWHDETASAGGEIGSLTPEQPDETPDELEANPEYICETVSSAEAK